MGLAQALNHVRGSDSFMWLGAHIGIADGLAEAVVTGRGIGCEAIQIFSKSPQMWGSAPIDPANAQAFREAVVREGLHSCAVHQSYLPNLASPKKALLGRSRKTFVDELRRAEQLGVPALIFHPGAHIGEGVDAGLRRIVESIDWAVGETPDITCRALLENAAGQGSTLGSTFEELAWVLDHVSDRARVGVTIDTCHLFASGVDFRTEEQYADVIKHLDATVGLADVRAFHLNDSKGPLGCKLDRHENIGKGLLGLEGFRHFLNDSQWASTPGYLETPIGDEGYGTYKQDLITLRSLVRTVPVPAPVGRKIPRRRVSVSPS
ncbi:MAG: deoxyribonuclease IV [Thermoplasmata archaeon]